MITVRFPHLKYKSPLKVGQTVKKNAIIGIMGDTGDAVKPGEIHLHLDAGDGVIAKVWRASQISSGVYKLAADELLQFITYDLLREDFHVSHWPHEYDYFKSVGFHHEGFDVITKNYPPKYDVFIRWPIDNPGECILNCFDKPGYGNLVNIKVDL